MYVRMYAEQPERLQGWRWGRARPLLALREVFQEHGHVSAWDGETLCLVLEEAGLPNAQVMPAGRSRIDPPPDLAERRDETVYAEALLSGG